MAASDTEAVGGDGPISRATAADVARLAGVSLKTVSRVYSGGPNVSAATRERVNRAAAALRFRPNTLARELRTGAVSTTVGLVIGEISNPFYFMVAAGVERALARVGLTLVIAATDDESRHESQVVGAMLERRVRALLLVPIAEDHGYLEGERRLGTPIVAVDRPLANAVSDSVVFDNRGGSRAGTRALIAAGHRRIGFVGSSPDLYTHGERLAGYRDALEAAGITVDPALERGDAPDIASAAAAATTLMDLADPPTAVFAGNNRAAIGVIQALRARSATLGLLAFDDFELAEALGISVVAHDPVAMGTTAADLALARLGDVRGVVRQVVLPTSVVERQSHLLTS